MEMSSKAIVPRHVGQRTSNITVALPSTQVPMQSKQNVCLHIRDNASTTGPRQMAHNESAAPAATAGVGVAVAVVVVAITIVIVGASVSAAAASPSPAAAGAVASVNVP